MTTAILYVLAAIAREERVPDRIGAARLSGGIVADPPGETGGADHRAL
jgi:hypothetical protein